MRRLLAWFSRVAGLFNKKRRERELSAEMDSHLQLHIDDNLRAGMSPERARRINAVMLTCGHYDGSGEFAYRVGLPGKSGVGGGILAIAPGKASIAVWSPGLDASGNSHLGRIALEALTTRMGWSIFGA